MPPLAPDLPLPEPGSTTAPGPTAAPGLLRLWQVPGSRTLTPVATFLLLGGGVTLLRIWAQEIPTFELQWKYVGYALYYVFTVLVWTLPALWLVRSGQRKWWEWLICLPPILWGTYCVPEMDRPAATLLVLPLVLRHHFGMRAAIVSGLILSVIGTYEYHYFAEDWGPNAYGVSVKDIFINFFLAVFQGIFSYGAYELALRNQEKQGQLQAAYEALRGYRGLELENTALQERGRLSRELHDSLGHQLTILRLESQKARRLLERPGPPLPLVAESVEMLVERSGEAFGQLQDIVSTLRETQLDGTLFQAMEQLAANWPGSVRLSITGQEPPLSSAARLALYRTFQEGLTNAYKYAGGQSVRADLVASDGQITLTIRNSLRPNARPPLVEWRSGGAGLSGLRQRLHDLGGTLNINQTEEAFEVCLTLPLPA